MCSLNHSALCCVACIAFKCNIKIAVVILNSQEIKKKKRESLTPWFSWVSASPVHLHLGLSRGFSGWLLAGVL